MKTCRLIAAVLVSVSLASCSPGEMSFKINDDGLVSMKSGGRIEIAPSPLGIICIGDTLYAPVSSRVSRDEVLLVFDRGEVVLEKTLRRDGSLRLEVTGIDDEIETFFFGPFVCPETTEVGDLVGAAWHSDGSLVCIQSLNPKTVGQYYYKEYLPGVNETGFPSPGFNVAYLKDGMGVLSCHADNYTRPRRVPVIQSGLKNIETEVVPAPEGSIIGAAIVLTRASDADAMLQKISELEIEEGLPHPVLDGEWAKTSPHASDIYFDFGEGDIESQIRIVKRAGVKWIYFSDPFESWGHFEVNSRKYPEGDAQFAAAVKNANSNGINVGTHTLSNFILVRDPYVTPLPDKNLLSFDPTPLAADISAVDSEIYVGEKLNYAFKQTLALVRIGDELIKYDSFDADRLCLCGCKRGVYGTSASAHSAGDTLTHMVDHGYGTLFPNFALQGEMAGRIGDFMNIFGLRRLSFDGLEGCTYTGLGEMAPNYFVKMVFDHTDGNIICDASSPSHYRWHAMSYFNWGEPWYDTDRRGGNYNYRARNQDYFRRNLLPGMLGWYKVCNSEGRYEPTLPETLEFILSRTVAYDAGCLLSYGITESDKSDNYLDMIKLWQDFRFSANIPDALREKMKERRSDWHLERSGDKWLLTEMDIRDYDLRYTDQAISITQMESGTAAYQPWGLGGSSHVVNVVLDRSSTDASIAPVVEPAHFRIRVGTPEEKGQLNRFSLCGGWGGPEFLAFDVTANAGEYLEYFGGTKLYRYDRDYNLIETFEGIGQPLVIDGAQSIAVNLRYNLSDDLTMTLKYIRAVQTFEL